MQHFVKEYAHRLNKAIGGIPDSVMNSLRRYASPGNIRELQNIIERADLLSEGHDLELSLPRTANAAPVTLRRPDHTLQEMERSYIADPLRRTNWVVGGRAGAVAKLGLPRTSTSRMWKLGIPCEDAWPQATGFSESVDEAMPAATPWTNSRRPRIVS